MTDLYRVRIQSFLWSFGSLILIAVAGVLVSSDFATLVKTNFGDTAVTGFLLLFVPEIAKHMKNVAALRKLGTHKIGSREVVEKVILI